MKAFAVRVYALSVALMISCGCASMQTHRLYDSRATAPEDVVQLLVPHYVDVLSLDTRDLGASGRVFIGNEDLYLLDPGPHDLVVRYSDLWPLGDDDHELVVSRQLKLSLDAAPGRSYAIRMDRPNDLEDARQLVNTAEIRIDELDQPVKKVLALPAASRRRHSKINAGSKPAEKMPPEAEINTSSLEALKSQWERAGPEDRREFRQWIDGR